MIARFAGLLAALVFASTAVHAEIVRTLEKVFPVEASRHASVRIETFHGSILVQPGEAKEIRVQVRMVFDADRAEKADQIRSRLSLDIQGKDGAVAISAEYSRSVHWTFENWPPVKLAYTITVPRDCDVDLHTRDGGITVGELRGKARVRTIYGLIYFKGIEGDITSESQFGDIVVAHCSGNLKLRSISGSFHVGPVGGFADVYGYGGEIDVQSAGGGIRAETSGADLVCGFRHPIVAPATLVTGGASILIYLNERSSCTLDLRASIFGRIVNVKDRLRLTARSGGVGRSRAVLDLNGGGPRIEAKASGGFIYLDGKEQPLSPVPAPES